MKKAQEALFIERLAHEHLGLEYRLDTDVGLLSGGQRQAITLVMATSAFLSAPPTDMVSAPN